MSAFSFEKLGKVEGVVEASWKTETCRKAYEPPSRTRNILYVNGVSMRPGRRKCPVTFWEGRGGVSGMERTEEAWKEWDLNGGLQHTYM